MLSVVQLNNKGCRLEFNEGICKINVKLGSLIAIIKQSRGKLFHLDTTIGSCLMEKVEDSWLWHKRLCHVNFGSIAKVSKTKSIIGMPNIVKPENAV